MSKVLNKIFNEDCLEGMKRIPDRSVDMILTDLPYGTTLAKWDSVIPFEPLWEQYKRMIKGNGAICLFGSEPFSSYLRISNVGMYKYDWIWKKNKCANFLHLKRQPAKRHELISVFYKKQPTYNPQMTEGDPYVRRNKLQSQKNVTYGAVSLENRNTENEGERYPISIIEINHEESIIHPTQKPVALFEYLIKTYTDEGETVLDSCMGSGTTAIACINTNRNYIGFELDKGYYEASLQRIEDHTRQVTIEELMQWQ